MTENKITPEMREIQKNVLKGNVSSVVGMNGVYAMGEEGKEMANKESLSGRFNDQRQNLWNMLKQDNKSNMPVEMPTNQATVNYGLRVAAEAKQMLTIGDLYEVLMDVRKIKDLEVPEQFKGKGLEDIAEDLKKVGGDINKLEGEKQDIAKLHYSLGALYDKKSAERTFCYNNGREYIDLIKETSEKYKTSEKKDE
ncbi:MAG: hypothetical protein P8X70_03590 [Nanoarchaeota archaeon]